MNEECGLCDGEGWQRFEIACPTMRRAAVQVRACGCLNAADKQRKADPLRPPAWARNDKGVWLPQTLEAVMKYPCTCPTCKPWLYDKAGR